MNESITKCGHVDKFFLKNYKKRRRGQGGEGVEDDGVFPVGILWGFFVSYVSFNNISLDFRLVLLIPF